jgi:hypothetical protein
MAFINDLFQKFLPKLRKHLFPRIIETLLSEIAQTPDLSDHPAKTVLLDISQTLKAAQLPLQHVNHSRVLIQSDRLYQHDILHLNYTSYDLRREQDVVNPNTSRRDVMCLTRHQPGTAHAEGNFAYARVIGIYHVNVAYSGPGSLDMKTRRFEFLWVRWYTPADLRLAEKPGKSLQRLILPDVASSPDSMGFLDPANVLRASHIIPRYHKGSKYENDGVLSHLHTGTPESSDEETEEPTLLKRPSCTHPRCQPLRGAIASCLVSNCAGEASDWLEYYVNR